MKRDHRKGEEGVALVVALVILLVLTVIGFSAISTTTFESNIVGNERVGTSAFYATEAVIEIGYNQLPDVTAIPRQQVGANSNAWAWSGKAEDEDAPRSLTHKGSHKAAGYDQSYSFSRYLIEAAGESYGASKEIESLARIGPYVGGTSYNN